MVNLISSSDINMRLDKYLSEQLVDYSRSQIQAMIQDGKVMINGRKEKSSYRLNGSEKIVIPQERAAENKVYCFNIKNTEE